MKEKITGGYFLKARCIQDSEIAHAPPHVREIWDWLVRKALSKEDGQLKKGQLCTSYKEIIEGLSWKVGFRKETYSKHNCETAMKLLTKAAMITTTKTAHGMIVTVCNYSLYQDYRNYDTYNETAAKPTTKLLREPHPYKDRITEIQESNIITPDGAPPFCEETTDPNGEQPKAGGENFEELYRTFIYRFNKATGKSKRGDAKSRGASKARLKEGITLDEIIDATENAAVDEHHVKNKLKWLTPEFMTRGDKIDKFRSEKPKLTQEQKKRAKEYARTFYDS